MSALAAVRAAVAADPRLSLLTGVAALGAVISIVLGYTGGDPQLAIIGGAFVVAFMILLAIFITITDGQNKHPRLAAFLIWSISLGFIASIALVVVSFFFCLPQALGNTCLQRGYVRGEITNLPSTSKKEVAVAFDELAMGFFRKDLRTYRFVIFEHRETDREAITVTVRPVDPSQDKDEDIKIHLSCVTPFLPARKMIEWRYAEQNVVQADGTVLPTPALFQGARKIGEFGRIEPIICGNDVKTRTTANWRRFMPGMSAFAQTPPATPTPELQSAIQDLTSEEAAVRRSARTTLAQGSVEAVPSILQAMRESAGNYRVLLGGSVALTEMLRQNKADAPRIAGIITAPEDRDLLLNAAGHSDRTLRIYASEFLYDLGDPEISRKALAMAARTGDENARYQWLLVAQGGWGKLKPDQKAAAAGDLSAARTASGPVTSKLLDKLN